jgi:hypothetical protein
MRLEDTARDLFLEGMAAYSTDWSSATIGVLQFLILICNSSIFHLVLWTMCGLVVYILLCRGWV